MKTKTPKLKKCGYSECGKPFLPQRPLQVACSVSCAHKYNDEKEVKKRVKEMESNITKLSVYEDLAKTVFQKWVRTRDASFACISCGKNEAKQWDGSHFFKAEIYSGVIFNEVNVNKSCAYCNSYLDGNLIGYRKGLVLKYGEERVNELEVLAIQTRQYKFTRDELLEIATRYKQKIKDGNFN